MLYIIDSIDNLSLLILSLSWEVMFYMHMVQNFFHIMNEIWLILQAAGSPKGCSHSTDEDNGENFEERDDDDGFHGGNEDGHDNPKLQSEAYDDQ